MTDHLKVDGYDPDIAPAMEGWRSEDRHARRGKPCQYGGCGITHLSAWHRSQRMWLCPYHTRRLS